MKLIEVLKKEFPSFIPALITPGKVNPGKEKQIMLNFISVQGFHLLILIENHFAQLFITGMRGHQYEAVSRVFDCRDPALLRELINQIRKCYYYVKFRTTDN